MTVNLEILERLAATIEARKGADPSTSYSASLIADPSRAARKLGEESVEAVVAALAGDRDELAAEAADVLYHLFALLAAKNVSIQAVMEELARREGTSGHAEKAAREEGK